MDGLTSVLKDFYDSIDKNLLGILITTIVGSAVWVYKELTQTPLQYSRDTFFKYTEVRIEKLSEIHNILICILLSPKDNTIKERLKSVLLSGKMAYIDEGLNAKLMRIAYSDDFNRVLYVEAIGECQTQLKKIIDKIRDENNYFVNRSKITPWRRAIGFVSSGIEIAISLGFIFIVLYYYLYALSNCAWPWKALVIAGPILVIIALNHPKVRLWTKNKSETLRKKYWS